MAMQLHQPTVETNQDSVMSGVDDALVEKLWQDLDEQLSREQIGRVVDQIAGEFQDATVKVFIPILIHRLALEQLKKQLDDERPPVATRASVDREPRHDQKPSAGYFFNRLLHNKGIG